MMSNLGFAIWIRWKCSCFMLKEELTDLAQRCTRSFRKIRARGNLIPTLFDQVEVDVCLIKSNLVLIRSDRNLYQICDEQCRSHKREQFREHDWIGELKKKMMLECTKELSVLAQRFMVLMEIIRHPTGP